MNSVCTGSVCRFFANVPSVERTRIAMGLGIHWDNNATLEYFGDTEG